MFVLFCAVLFLIWFLFVYTFLLLCSLFYFFCFCAFVDQSTFSAWQVENRNIFFVCSLFLYINLLLFTYLCIYMHVHLKSQPLLLPLVIHLNCLCWLFSARAHVRCCSVETCLTLNQHQLKEWLNDWRFHYGVPHCQAQSRSLVSVL